MPLNKYRVLSKIAETGKMHEAAQELIYSKQNLSRITKALEEEYGFSLFVRSRDGVQLTENARKLLPAVKKIIEAEDELLEIINQIRESEGLVRHIRIGAVGSMVLGLVQQSVNKMEQLHNDLTIDVRYLIDGKFFREGLKNGDLDFCIIADGFQEDFFYEQIMKECFYAVVSIHHELADRKELTIEDMMKYPTVMTPDCPFLEEISRKSNLRQYIVDDEIISIPIIETNGAIGILSAVSQYDLGPYVVTIPIREKRYRTLGIASCKERKMSPVAEEFKAVVIDTADNYYK